MESKKWMVRAGSLLVLLGFVLPSLTVSCSGLLAVSHPISLAQMAGQFNQSLLYLVPIGALAVLILAFIPMSAGLRASTLFWGQVGGAAISVISIFLTLLTISNQVRQYGFDLNPELGLFVLIAGYALIAVGLVLQLSETSQQAAVYAPPVVPAGGEAYPGPLREQSPAFSSPVVGTRLEVVRGNLPQTSIALMGERFTIGRGPDNDLQLPETSVSRTHAHLRYAQGTWFLQDQGSISGTFVNGNRIEAIRLKTGDQITIGEHIFVFHME
jgi:hypothetical protein